MKANKPTLLILSLLFVSLFVTQCRVDEKYDNTITPPTPIDCETTIVEVERPNRFPSVNNRIPADNLQTVDGIELGRILFYDSNLAIDNTTNCATCHKPEFGFGDDLQVSINAVGMPTQRNSMPLVNTLWMDRLFWDGRSETLEDAVLDALTNELHINWASEIEYLKTDTNYTGRFEKAFNCETASQELVIKALSQFIRSIVSNTSKFDGFLAGESLSAEQMRGFQLFVGEEGNCFHCHFTSPLLTTNDFRNNGLDDITNINDFPDLGYGPIIGDDDFYGTFKIPSLRNISYTAPYMHDGRFSTLEEVLDFYSDSVKQSPTIHPLMNEFPGGVTLTAQEKSDLIAFLRVFDDTAMMNNPAYGDPLIP